MALCYKSATHPARRVLNLAYQTTVDLAIVALRRRVRFVFGRIETNWHKSVPGLKAQEEPQFDANGRQPRTTHRRTRIRLATANGFG